MQLLFGLLGELAARFGVRTPVQHAMFGGYVSVLTGLTEFVLSIIAGKRARVGVVHALSCCLQICRDLRTFCAYIGYVFCSSFGGCVYKSFVFQRFATAKRQASNTSQFPPNRVVVAGSRHGRRARKNAAL